MKIEISITRNGHGIGTIGWLAEKCKGGSIHIGTTKSGKQAAWLKDAAGAVVTVLAVRGAWDDAQIVKAENGGPGYELSTDVTFTPAAWNAIGELMEIAVERMNDGETADVTPEVTVSAGGFAKSTHNSHWLATQEVR